MHLGDKRPIAVGEALDHPQLPQRLTAVEVLREDPAGQVSQFLCRARPGRGCMADVIEDLEMWVVHPDGTAEPHRDETHALAVARKTGEVRDDGPHKVAVARRWTLKHRHVADVHRVALILNRNEHRILGAHAI